VDVIAARTRIAMSRTGLTIALAIGLVLGLICAVDPRLDVDIAAMWFNTSRHLFDVNAQAWVQHTREAARIVITLLVLPAFVAILGKLVWPRRRMLIEARASIFLIATLALGPGLLTNVILKDHWGRPRPIDVHQFGGDYRFVPWWDPHGGCPDNCSFIAGEPSGAFWTLAPAALAAPELQPVAYAAALAFGAGVGVLRIAAGAHFFSDVVFAGVFMYLVIWLMHGLIYRWRPTRIDEAAAERRLAEAGEALTAVARRLIHRRDKSA
jgi:membrane-associated PAP2 superfamily phosphatase